MIKTQAGVFDAGFIVTWDGMFMAYKGVTRDEYIKYGPWTELRLIPGYIQNPVYLVIVDEGPGTEINELKDLHGVKFSAGIVGSATEFNIRTQLAVLGIEPEWVPAGYGDVVTMAKDLEIVGFAKSSPYIQLDSSMLDVQSVRKIKILSWTPEQLEVGLKATPGTCSTYIEKGIITALPEQPGFYTLGHTTGNFLTTAFSQDVGYRMVKAYVDHWDELCEAFPASKAWEILETDLQLLSSVAEVTEVLPYHAGAVQLMEERGYKVPAELIPPEYKR